MEFFIRKNSTLPIIKVQVVKDGRVDFREFDNLTSTSTITFSMWDEETNRYVVVNKPALTMVKESTGDSPEVEHYVYYQLSSHETRRPGRYIGEFKISNEQGEITLPLRNKLFINVRDSISVPDLCCRPNRGQDAIVLPSETPRPTPSVTPSVSITPTPSITPSVTITPTSSVTPTPSITPSVTITPTSSITPSVTITPNSSLTPTPSVTPSVTITPTSSVTPSVSIIPSPSITPSSSVTPTPSITPTNTITPTITVTPSSSTYVPSSRILYYDFNDTSSYGGSTVVFDLEGNSDGTVYNSGAFNDCYQSIQFNGTNGYVTTNIDLNSQLSPANTSTVISLFTWFYPTGDGVIVSEQGSATPDTGWYDSQIQIVSGNTYFSVWTYTIGSTASPVIQSSISTPLNQWHYLGLTYDGTILSAYVNGSPAGSVVTTRLTPHNNGSTQLHYALAYGTQTNFTSGQPYGVGRMGTFEVYNRALSQTQITNLYNNTSSQWVCPTPTPSITPSVTTTVTPSISVSPTPSSSVVSSSVWQLRRIIDPSVNCNIDTSIIYRANNTLGAVSSEYIKGTDGFCYLVVSESPGTVNITMSAGPYIVCSSCLT